MLEFPINKVSKRSFGAVLNGYVRVSAAVRENNTNNNNIPYNDKGMYR